MKTFRRPAERFLIVVSPMIPCYLYVEIFLPLVWIIFIMSMFTLKDSRLLTNCFNFNDESFLKNVTWEVKPFPFARVSSANWSRETNVRLWRSFNFKNDIRFVVESSTQMRHKNHRPAFLSRHSQVCRKMKKHETKIQLCHANAFSISSH